MALWITDVFYISLTGGIEAISSLILIHLHLNKLSCHCQIRTASLSTNHTIKSLLECHNASDSNPHHLLLDKVIFKQRLKIKSSIVDVNNCLNSILLAFNSLHKELSFGFCLIDIFQNCFSFNSVDQKVNDVKCTQLRKIMLLHQSLILIVVIILWLGLFIMLSISLQQRLNYLLSGVKSTK